MKKTIFVAIAMTFAIQSTAFAKEETSAMASPKCDAAKLKEIGGDGVVKVEKGAWEGGYNVTIETDKTNSGELIQKMVAAGCM
jgi:hypothetical protein